MNFVICTWSCQNSLSGQDRLGMSRQIWSTWVKLEYPKSTLTHRNPYPKLKDHSILSTTDFHFYYRLNWKTNQSDSSTEITWGQRRFDVEIRDGCCPESCCNASARGHLQGHTTYGENNGSTSQSTNTWLWALLPCVARWLVKIRGTLPGTLHPSPQAASTEMLPENFSWFLKSNVWVYTSPDLMMLSSLQVSSRDSSSPS